MQRIFRLMLPISLALLGVLALFWLLDAPAAQSAPTGWTYDLIDIEGEKASLAIDAENRPHVAYLVDGVIPVLNYAYLYAGEWITDAVVAVAGLERAPALAIDSDGLAHIAFANPAGALVYTYQKVEGWLIDIVDMDFDPNCHISLVLDSANRPHLSYCYDPGTGTRLQYATLGAVNWTITTVDREGGAHNQLVLNSDGLPRIAYRADGGGLRYAYLASSTWYTETIDAHSDGNIALMLAPNGQPEVSYTDTQAEMVVHNYAVRQAGAWVTGTLSIDSGFAPGLALAHSGVAHLSTYESLPVGPASFGDLYYYHRVPALGSGGSAWHEYLLDDFATEWEGGVTDLALDPTGSVHIAYDSPDAGLRYARISPTAPEKVEFTGLTGGLPGNMHTFGAGIQPPTSTLPLTYTWQATNQETITHVGALSDSITYLWPEPGEQIITLTVDNPAGGLQLTHNFRVNGPIFLPCLSQRLCNDINEDFSDPASGWPELDTSAVRSAYANGTYRVELLQANDLQVIHTPYCEWQNYHLEVEAHWEGGLGNTYGLVFGLKPDLSAYYLLEVRPNRDSYRLRRWDGAQFIELQPPTVHGAIHSNDSTNRLAVDRAGDQISIFINGTFVKTFTDDNLTGKLLVGLAATTDSGYPMTAVFDNFRVDALPITP